MNEKPFKLVEEDIVSCCSWCFPGSTIIAAFPELTGKKISHGICPKHMVDFRKELDAMAFLSLRK